MPDSLSSPHLPSYPWSNLQTGCAGQVNAGLCGPDSGYCTAGKYKGCQCQFNLPSPGSSVCGGHIGDCQKDGRLAPLSQSPRYRPCTQQLSDLKTGCAGYIICDTHFGFCTAGKYKGCDCGVGIGKAVRARDTDVANDACGTTLGDCTKHGEPALYFSSPLIYRNGTLT